MSRQYADKVELLVLESDPRDERGTGHMRVGIAKIDVERGKGNGRKVKNVFVLETRCIA